jgi:transposase
MRGSDGRSGALFSYVDLEDRVPRRHPLRPIRTIVNETLDALSRDFERLYGPIGRPSIPPEKLLRALLLQAFYSIRSERQLMERLDFDLLFRWFVGLGIDDPVWDHSTFSKNRDRLLGGDVAARFLAEVLNRPKVRRLLSAEHFSVDGTLVEAWASMKSFRRKDAGDEDGSSGAGGRNRDADFRGQKRRNDTHASTSDGDARLYRKGHGQESRLAYLGHLLSENRHGLVVRAAATRADGRAEWEAGLAMVGDLAGRHRITVGGDKGYDVQGFAAGLRALGATHTSPSTATSPRPADTAAPRSTAGPPAIAAMRKASVGASWSRRRSAGSRPSPVRRRPGSEGSSGSAGRSSSRPPPTT